MTNLAEYGVTAETQTKFSEIINSYNNAMMTPRNSKADKKSFTRRLSESFVSADAAILDMDFAAGVIKMEKPDFYNDYKTVRQIFDLNGGRLALKATVTDLVNGQPVMGATFTFTNGGSGTITKKTTKSGNFQVKSMLPGTYKAVITKEGYRDTDTVVTISEGERSELKVKLEKV